MEAAGSLPPVSLCVLVYLSSALQKCLSSVFRTGSQSIMLKSCASASGDGHGARLKEGHPPYSACAAIFGQLWASFDFKYPWTN